MDTTKREHIILRHLAGALTEEEERELNTWRQASPDNDGLYIAHQKLWHVTVPENPPLDADLDAEWDRLRRRLRLDAPPKARILPLRRVWTYAAAAVVLILAGTLWFTLAQTTPQTISVATVNAETKAVTLADGSTARLNSGTTLLYPSAFAEGERRVQLQGEALFEVVEGAAPFVVGSENAEVRVLGTVFNVWARGEETRVAVREGRVALEAPDGSAQRVEVTANQAAVRRGDQAPEVLGPAYADDALGWLDGRIVFERTPLAEVIAELTRRYDQPIQLRAANLAAETISGTFSDKPLDAVLASVCLSLECRFVEEEGVYVITE